MALTGSLPFMGFTADSCYARVEDFTATKKEVDGVKSFDVRAHVNFYKDSSKEVCLKGEMYNGVVEYANGTVDLAKIYDFVKTFPELQGWLDA